MKKMVSVSPAFIFNASVGGLVAVSQAEIPPPPPHGSMRGRGGGNPLTGNSEVIEADGELSPETYDEETKAAADASPFSFTSMEEKLTKADGELSPETYDEDTKAAADTSPFSFTSMKEKEKEKETQKLLESEMFAAAVKKVMQGHGVQKVMDEKAHDEKAHDEKSEASCEKAHDKASCELRKAIKDCIEKNQGLQGHGWSISSCVQTAQGLIEEMVKGAQAAVAAQESKKAD